jgi:hypothetical protein
VAASLQKPKPKDIRNAFINEAEKLKKIEEAEAIKVEVWHVANIAWVTVAHFLPSVVLRLC